MNALPGLGFADDIIPPASKRIRLDDSLQQCREEQDLEFDDDDIYNEGTPIKESLLNTDTRLDSAKAANVAATKSPVPSSSNPAKPIGPAVADDVGRILQRQHNISAEESAAKTAVSGDDDDDFYGPVPCEAETRPQPANVSDPEQVQHTDQEGSTTSTLDRETTSSETVDASHLGIEMNQSQQEQPHSAVCDMKAPSIPASQHDQSDVRVEEHDVVSSERKATEDQAFMAAAEENKDNVKAEWRFDSSDADSSDSTSSNDTSSDSDSEDSSDDDAELLDPEAQAKLLLEALGDEDEAAPSGPLRTVNEKDEEMLPKPEITVTPDMKITELGFVENIVGNFLVIKGITTGTYQVVEAGSALCTEDRTVIGAVMEPMSRVQQPMYSMGFKDAQELVDAGVGIGTKLYYVDAHSTFVFTEPLKAQKGTDASNLHDEEIGREEIEFSDDEKEAAYKRDNKKSRGGRKNEQKGGRAHDRPGLSHKPSRMGHPDDVGMGVRTVPINYGDDEEEEEIYRPLKRPDNFTNGQSPPPAPVARGRGGRGGRGPGDRGGGGRNRGHGGGHGPPGGFGSDRGSGRGNNRYKGNGRGFGSDQRNGNQQDAHNQRGPPSYSRERDFQEPSHANPSYSSFSPQHQSSSHNQHDGQPGYSHAGNSHAPHPQLSFNPMALLGMLPAGSHFNPAMFAQNLAQLPSTYTQTGSQTPVPAPYPPQDPRLHHQQQQGWQQNQHVNHPPPAHNQQQQPCYQPQQYVPHQQGPGGDRNGSLQAQANLADILRHLTGGSGGS